jgi:hypothetical protein
LELHKFSVGITITENHPCWGTKNELTFNLGGSH